MKIKIWIKAMRLRTLPLSFASILMGGALAYLDSGPRDCEEYDGPSFGKFSWVVFWLCLLTTLLLQVLSNFANDYGDYLKGTDNDERVGPVRTLQSGAIAPIEMKKALYITATLSFISGLTLLLASLENNSRGFLFFLFVGLLAIAAAIFYTIGKRAYGYSGFGDLFVFLFFGLLGVCGPYYLLTGLFDLSVLFPAITMGMFAVAVLNLNNMRDIEGDKKAGKNTVAVILGFKRAKTYHLTLFTLAYISLALATEFLPIVIIFLPFILPVLLVHLIHIFIVFRTIEPAKLDSQLKIVALSSFLFSLIFFCVIGFG